LLSLADHWVWDSWHAETRGVHHLFFLRAPRALLDPDRRHDHASIGHATSRDLRHWAVGPVALARADGPSWDDMAIWTGSVVRAPDGDWRLFYTGRSYGDGGRVQRIGTARSHDLVAWRREGPVLAADRRWYEKLDAGDWPDEAWRDPYVVADPGGDGWHMLLTARAPDGPAGGRGVIGHARSADLRAWEIGLPLTAPSGFGHMEVPRVATIDGRHVLMFSCWPDRLEDDRRSRWRRGGLWVAPGASLLGPWDLASATTLDHPSLYAANFVEHEGGWYLLGFRDTEDGAFPGVIADPLPLEGHGATVRIAEGAGPR
jgi:beta-fructofuranosidase